MTEIKPSAPEDLEERFTAPSGWRWHTFEREEGRRIRFGSVFPNQGGAPDAIVVCLQGVREFTEKYYEVARWCVANNLAFWMCDWAGQGGSVRFLDDNPCKRHSTGFDDDIADLHYFIQEYIKHSSVHTDVGRIPMAMLAHSMGANIGLRYITQHPGAFECAAFSAPMVGIKIFQYLPNIFTRLLTSGFSIAAGKSYVFGGCDWGKRTERVKLSSDPVRSKIAHQWCEADESLRTGDLTFRWLHEAHKSCIKVQSLRNDLKRVKTPIVFATAEHEGLVDNKKTNKLFSGLSFADHITCRGAHHEILMEKDSVRQRFLNEFHALITEAIIERPERLKPF